MKQTRTLTEGAILAALFVSLLAITLYVPFAAYITMWALPLPFILFVVRRGLKPGLMLLVVAILLSFMIAGLLGLPGALFFGAAGLVIGELYRRKLAPFNVLIGGSLIYMLNMLLVYVGLTLFMDENPIQFMTALLREQIQLAEATLIGMGQDPSDSLAPMYEMTEMIVHLVPIMIIMSGIGLAILTVLLATVILRRLGNKVEKFPPFRDWQFPKSFLWYYLIVMILLLVGQEEGSTMYIIVWNLLPLLEIVMMVQGFAFIFYYCYHKKVNRALPIIIVIVTLIVNPLTQIIRIIGIIDLGFDLRKRIKSEKK
ncbi:YybS family protein [Alkalihalophilus sp. As8PL]|uniref:YybS family protein n=1 Tax=Alkalihalophilus sp. As8PL TaxID=3237103 RepID=A0AB39BPE9_9BACI